MARKAQGSRGPKGSTDSGRVKPDRVVLKLSLDRETVRRLKLESFGRDVAVGQVVDDLVAASPRRFVLMDRSKGQEGPAGPVNAPSPGPIVSTLDRLPLGVVGEAS